MINNEMDGLFDAPFREALERRALPPHLCFVSEILLGKLTPSVERRSLLLALEL